MIPARKMELASFITLLRIDSSGGWQVAKDRKVAADRAAESGVTWRISAARSAATPLSRSSSEYSPDDRDQPGKPSFRPSPATAGLNLLGTGNHERLGRRREEFQP